MSSDVPRRLLPIAALAAFLILLLAAQTNAAPAANTIVTPSSPNGWAAVNVVPGSTATISPQYPRDGSGSLRFTSPGSSGKADFEKLWNEPSRTLEALTGLSYDFYRSSSSTTTPENAHFAPVLRLAYLTPTFESGLLIWEPVYNGFGAVPVDQWHSVDIFTTGHFWMRAFGSPNRTIDFYDITLAEWLSGTNNGNPIGPDGNGDVPHVLVPGTRIYGVNTGIGSGWAGTFDGAADNIVLTFGPDIESGNFEPETQCTTTCYVNGTTGNDTFGGDTPATAKKTIQAALDQVSPGGTVIVAAGTYTQKLTISKSLTLRGAGPTTIIDGSGPSTASGIQIIGGITDVTIEDLRVQDQAVSGENAAIYFVSGNHGLTVQDVDIENTTGGRAGLLINGPVDDVLVDGGNFTNNAGRAIVIWNGYKSNIKITNNTVTGSNCCGIELQDGTASGVTITGNDVTVNNGDSAIAAMGLMAGAGANLIADNDVTTRGRFGIEIKLPNGTGLDNGDGSIVVEDNEVTFAGTLADDRDLAGIAVFRRDYVIGNNNVDIPTGVIVRNNTVSGFQQPSNSDGFGIVVEGTNMTVTGNTVTNNDVGIQLQAGHLPYSPDSATNGLQDNIADQYFGRGNSPIGCAAISGNTFSGNGTNERRVGPVGGGTVTNLGSAKSFCSIQAAHDDAATANGHVLSIGAGTYVEQVEITKAVTLDGAGEGLTVIQAPVTLTKSFTVGPNTNKPVVWIHDQNGVIIRDLKVDGAGRGNANPGLMGIAYQNAGGTVADVTVTGMRDTPRSGNQYGTGIYGIVTNGTPRTLNVTGSTVVDFQKNGMTLVGTGLTVDVAGNEVVGSGPLPSGEPAQNGIQLSGDAAGTIHGNIVKNIAYIPASWLAVGVLVDDAAAGVVVRDNQFTETMTAVYMGQTNGTVSGNTSTNSVAGMGATPYWWTIIADAGVSALQRGPDGGRVPAISPMEEAAGEATMAPQAGTVTISNNTLNMGGNGTGIEGDAYAGQPLTVTMTGNSVSNSDVAISLYESGGGTLAATVSGNTLTNSGQIGTGIEVLPGASAVIGSDAPLPINPAVSNDITGFEDGIQIAGTATVRGNYGSISGNAVGIHVLSGGT